MADDLFTSRLLSAASASSGLESPAKVFCWLPRHLRDPVQPLVVRDRDRLDDRRKPNS
jgi:hypothetical protein